MLQNRKNVQCCIGIMYVTFSTSITSSDEWNPLKNFRDSWFGAQWREVFMLHSSEICVVTGLLQSPVYRLNFGVHCCGSLYCTYYMCYEFHKGNISTEFWFQSFFIISRAWFFIQGYPVTTQSGNYSSGFYLKKN